MKGYAAFYSFFHSYRFYLDQTQISHGWNNGITVNSFDPDGDSYSCTYRIGLNGTEYSANANGWTLVPASRFTPGTNDVYVKCTGTYGAYGQPSSQTVTDYSVPNSAPGSLSPSNGQELAIASSYSFSFSGVSGGVPEPYHYQVTIADNAQYTNPVESREVAGSPFSEPDTILQSGKTYYWKICAENVTQTQGPCSETWFKIAALPTISNVQVSPASATNGDTISISWNSTNQNHWFTYLYDSTGTSPVNTSSFLGDNCSAAGSNGNDGCLNQANPSSATSTTWTIPANLAPGIYTIKVKVWNSSGQPPAGVGRISNAFTVTSVTPPDLTSSATVGCKFTSGQTNVEIPEL